MSAFLTRCRDADMMGPVCDVITDDKPICQSIQEMRVNAQIHNEPDITDDDTSCTEQWLRGGEGCCVDLCCYL